MSVQVSHLKHFEYLEFDSGTGISLTHCVHAFSMVGLP